jgi:hypothetical protein
MNNPIISSFVLVLVLMVGSTAASAQAVPASNNPSGGRPPLSEGEIALMRGDLRSEKKKIVAMNVPLTDVEATKFWPVYDQYVAEMKKWNDEFYHTVKDYAENSQGWTDAQASAMLDKWVKVQIEQAKTRQKYAPLIEKVIPAKKAALFFQIDRRLYALMDLQVSTFLPLTQ